MTVQDLLVDERMEIAERMLEKGMSIEDIKACTKLTDGLMQYVLESFKEKQR